MGVVVIKYAIAYWIVFLITIHTLKVVAVNQRRKVQPRDEWLDLYIRWTWVWQDGPWRNAARALKLTMLSLPALQIVLIILKIIQIAKT